MLVHPDPLGLLVMGPLERLAHLRTATPRRREKNAMWRRPSLAAELKVANENEVIATRAVKAAIRRKHLERILLKPLAIHLVNDSDSESESAF